MKPTASTLPRLAWVLSLLALLTLVLASCNTDASQLAGASLAEEVPSETPTPAAMPGEISAAGVEAQADTQAQAAAAAAQLQLQSDGALQIDYNANTGAARWVATEGNVLTQEFAGQNLSAENVARSFLNTYGRLVGVAEQSSELQLQQVESDELGKQHVTFQQQQGGVEVFGADLNVHVDGEGAVQLVNGYTLPAARTVNLAPTLSPEAAAQAAIAYTGLADGVVSSSKVVIFNAGLITDESSATYLTYQLRVDSAAQPEAALWLFVDAATGEVRFSYPAVTDARNRNTYNAQGGYTSGALLARNETGAAVTTAPNCTATDINRAHDYTGQAYDFYFSRFGRDSYDGAGAPLNSYVCYGRNMQNAYWDGMQMIYGNGFALDDVIGHELSHAVTERISNLVYSRQSGALNESFSDIMGEALDLTNNSGNDAATVRWDMGEEIASIGAIRDMMDPLRFNNPDRTDSPKYDCASQEVHINSGVQNKAFALMVDGGSFNGYTIAPVGVDKAVKVIYRANDLYLTSSAKFIDAYNAINRSCNELYGAGSADCTNVKKALDATKMAGPICGVGGAPQPTPTPTPNPTAGNWLNALDGTAWLNPQDYPTFCLNLPYNRGTNGATVSLFQCDGHNSKRWIRNTDGTIRPKDHPTFCLNLHNNAGVDGATINLWSCNGNPAQKWNADANHNLHPQDYPAYCLNLHNNAGVNDATVNLWRCNGTNAQKWQISYAEKPLTNGDFEAGRNVGWAETDAQNYPVVGTGGAQSGNWRAWLAGADNGNSTLSQSIKVPATGGILTYGYKIDSGDSCGYDFAYVEVNGTSLKTYNLCRTNATTGYAAGTVSLTAYAGQLVTIRFRATTDKSILSSFYVDNVAITAGALAETADPHASTGPITPEAKPTTIEATGGQKGATWQLFLPLVNR